MLGEPNDTIPIPIRRVGHATRSCFTKDAKGEALYKLDVLSAEIDHLVQADKYVTKRLKTFRTLYNVLVEVADADDDDEPDFDSQRELHHD